MQPRLFFKSFPILASATFAFLSFTAAPIHGADNQGIYVKRTEHKGGDVSNNISREGGFVELRIPSGTAAVSFWLKRDRGSDSNTNDTTERQNRRFIAFRPVTQNPWNGMSGADILTDDENWHYHLFAFIESGGEMLAHHYLDGSQVANASRSGGPVSEFFFIVGTNIKLLSPPSESIQFKRSTDFNFILDDVAVWSKADQSLLDNFTEVAHFGMERFDATNPDLLHYYTCDTPEAAPVYSDDLRVNNLGDTPQSSWYDFNLPTGGVTLQDASSTRREKIQVTVNSQYGVDVVTPQAGVSLYDYDGTSQSVVSFSAPQYIYLNRYGVELGSSDDDNQAEWIEEAVYRARNLGYAISLGGRPDTSGIERFFSQPATENIDITWHWELEYAVILDSATDEIEGLTDALGNPTLSQDGQETEATFGRTWVAAGTSIKAAIDGIILPDGTEQNVSFRSTGYTIESNSGDGSGDRYLALSPGNDHLTTQSAGISFGSSKSFTLEFWARRGQADLGTESAIVDVGGMWVGFSGDDSLRFGSHTDWTPSLGNVDLGTEWRHWAYQFDEESRIVNIYIDGILLHSESNADPANWDFSAIDSVLLGASTDDSGTILRPFGGDVDNMRLWSKALTQDEIQSAADVDEYGAQADLALELSFDNLSDVEFGAAATFLQDDDAMSIDTIVLPTDYTLEARVLFPLPDTPSGWRYPFWASVLAAENNGSPIAFNPSGGLVSHGNGTSSVVVDTGSFSPGWHRLSVTVQGNDIRHFVDGAFRAGRKVNINRSLNLIGAGSLASASYAGWLDDVRVWNVARSDAEIAGDWDQPLSGTESGLAAYYTFDDGTGRNVVGTGNDGVFVGSAQSGLALMSSEGSNIIFGMSELEGLLGESRIVSVSAEWHAVVFPHRVQARHQATAVVTTENVTVQDWIRITWNWSRTFRLQIEVNDNIFGDLPFIVSEDGAFFGIDDLDNIWVPELSKVTVGTFFRDLGGCYTLDADNGVSAQLNAFRDITMESLVDGFRDGRVTREYSLPGITKPGTLLFTYKPTVYRAEVALGEGFDASATSVANAQLVPNLCGAEPRLAIGPNGGPGTVQSPPLSGGATSSGEAWVWDALQNIFYPLTPGTYTLTWPDAANPDKTYAIEIIAAFPEDTVTIENRENDDGSRQDPPDYTTDVTFDPVSEAFPASPGSHYSYAYMTDASKTPPVALDPNPDDRFYFQRTAYAESAQFLTDSTGRNFSSTAAGRAVLLYSVRANASEVASGDVTREIFLPRIVSSVPASEVTQSEQAFNLEGDYRLALSITASNGLYGSPAGTGSFYGLGGDASRTWESWIRLHDENVQTNADRIIFEVDVQSGPNVVQFGVRAPSHFTNPGGFFFSVQSRSDGVESVAFELSDVVVDAAWHHWAVVMDSDSGSVRFYRDGLLVDESFGSLLSVLFAAGNNQHSYGYSPNEPGSWLDGVLDNIRFWGKALETDEVRQSMRQRSTDTNNLPYFSYSFDQGTTSDLVLKDADLDYEACCQMAIRSASGAASSDPDRALLADPYDRFPEVATRLRSKLDTAGHGSGYLVNRVSNYNPNSYNRTADVGAWGPIFPVNWSGLYEADNRALQVFYYENPSLARSANAEALHPNVAWPYVAVAYTNVTFPQLGEDADKRIYIASRLGTEGVDATGVDQLVFDPERYGDPTIYNQPDPNEPGYNPNEEHALIAPSIKPLLVGDPAFDLNQSAAFALQNEWNRTDMTDVSLYTSEPWVLVEWEDLVTGEADMAAYRVETIRTGSALFPALDPETHLPTDALGQPVPQPTDPTYDFVYPSFAGDLVNAPYPLNLVVGNVTMEEDAGADSNQLEDGTFQRTIWFDKNINPWVISGDSQFVYRFWYPMRDDFWAEAGDQRQVPNVGDPIAWLPSAGTFLTSQTPYPTPQVVLFNTYWREDYPTLKRGESMTYVGGENKADHPLEPGLPGIVGWESAQVVFDSRTPGMRFTSLADLDDYSARAIRPLDRYRHTVDQTLFSSLVDEQGAPLTPASANRVQVVGSRWYFSELTGSLQKRFYFDSLLGELVFRGRLNDLEGGDPDLTATPVSLYALESNVMTPEDYEQLLSLGTVGITEWEEVIDLLYLTSQNPHGVTVDGVDPASPEFPVYLAGIESGVFVQNIAQLVEGEWVFMADDSEGALTPLNSLGTGTALVPNPTLLAEADEEPLYLTLVENNHEEVAGAVTLHIIRIGEERFRGAIKVVEAQNVFDEKINLRHTADFGGNTEEAYYQWWVRNVDALDEVRLPEEEVEWQLYGQGLGLNQIEFSGRPDILMADKLFYVRYGEQEELDAITGNDTATGSIDNNASWRLVDPNDLDDDYTRSDGGPVPFQWAGAANSPQLQADGSKRFIPQLVMGWVKRVLDRVNPYEARFSAHFSGNAPATFSSMMQEAGKPFNGEVALNSDRDSLENVGLIELYETVLARARELTLEVPGVADSGINQALLLAATRLAVLYELLASEAYADAMNPSLPVTDEQGLPVPGENGLATANPFTHAFQNQVSSLLQEELALLRGTDFLKAYPVFNRLFWNYVKGLGEAAYNINYRIVDITEDGVINELDAATLFPQGHGDAWGHYLSANKMHYDLLRHPAFDWEARAELYSLLDNVLPADYLDEKSFVRIAAAKARAGDQIVTSTYRLAYTEDPDGQWQGYTDSADPARAWGLSEWSKRTGQAALFDWITGNAIVPARAEENEENLDRIDRIANQLELGEVAASLNVIQHTLDESNAGKNPLGLSPDALTFDINPLELQGNPTNRKSHFEQIWERAVVAAQNALTGLAVASRSDLQLHRTAENTRELQIQALRQDFDYRSRLIEIYGTPYEGTIGPGQIYDEGYTGPDTLLFMYIDRTDLEELEPTVASTFATLQFDLKSLSKGWSVIDSGVKPRIPEDVFNPENVQRLFSDFNITEEFRALKIASAEEAFGNVITIEAPLQEASRHAFAAPEEWGERAAYGRIQILLNELLAAQQEMDLEVETYNDYVKDVSILNKRVSRELDLIKARIKARNTTEATLATLEALAIVFEALEKGFEEAATESWRESQVISTAFPVVAGPFAVDAFAAARGAVEQAGFLASGVGRANQRVNALLGFVNQEAKAAVERIAENDQERLEDYAELLELLSEFGAQLQEEPLRRNRITGKLQQMEILVRELKAVEAKGERLQNERAAFNTVLASKAQRNRYKDMVTRITRNDVLGRYQNALENAQRYAWLAAKAYEYETSLDPGSPAAATSLLERIIKTRQLGLWEGGLPQTGNGGLAEILAQLKANFQVLRGQLGINNPQYETGQLSLRREHYRILSGSTSSDTRWAQALGGARVDDLWQVPEFRRFCRPFAPRSEGAQPGLVIEFATSINPGKNVFGRPLAGGDNAFSSANFATKISAIGAWFEGYVETALSTTPRVYLVPVGDDVLRISDALEPEPRVWDVLEQRIPVPYVINSEQLNSPGFIPSIEGLDGSFDEIRRFGDFRAYHSTGSGFDSSQLTTDSRLIGRSVWNTRWLLIIPGAHLSADADAGLDAFIASVTDIKLLFQTYANQGL